MKDPVLLWFNQRSQCYEVAKDDGNDEATAKDCGQVSSKLDIVKMKSALSKSLQRAVGYENGKRPMNRRRMKAIDYKEDMITWEETHAKEKLFKCRHCDQEFKSALLRTKHEKATHTKHDVKYNCDKCSYSTFTKGCFTTHLKRHIKQYNLFCEECNMGFFNNTELTSHNIKFHEMQPFQCALCNDIFTSKGNLYSHIKSHDPNNSYVCEICGRTYKKKNSFKRHIARAHLGLTVKAQCAVCQKVLSSKEHLRRHMLTHTDERNWVCSTCGKCFLSKTYLTEHCRIHLGIRPYKCEICEKSFTQRGSLTIHKRSHTGERPYRCEFCNKGFVMSTLLRYHLKKCNEAKMNTHAKGYSAQENISDDTC